VCVEPSLCGKSLSFTAKRAADQRAEALPRLTQPEWDPDDFGNWAE
jgi:hypothetical protein